MGKGLEQTLLQGRHTEGPETYVRMFSSLAIRVLQIETTMRYHFTLVRMAIITNQQVLASLWSKWNPSALLVGMQSGEATVENSMEFPQKTENGTAFCPGNSTAGNVTYSKDLLHPYVHSSVIYNSQVLEAT